MDAESAASRFTHVVLQTMDRFNPTRILAERNAKHPWLDDDCARLIRRKKGRPRSLTNTQYGVTNAPLHSN